MSNNKHKIIEEISTVVEKLGYLPIEIVFRGDDRNIIIEVFIDNETGITTEDCKLVNLQLNQIIEEKELIKSKYRLDVSSPGVERPLKFFEQYKKHINRKFEIEYIEESSVRKVAGYLINIQNSKLIFKINKEEKTINFGDIKKARVLVSF